jgi:hypothetical protein
MVIPTVTELRRALEPTTADPFIRRPFRHPDDARTSESSRADASTTTTLKEPRHDE